MTHTLSPDDYRAMARDYYEMKPARLDDYYNVCYTFNAPVVAKGRPRSGKSGKMYTPKETREFEQKVAKWAKSLAAPVLLFPVAVDLTIYEKTDDADLIRLSSKGFTYNEKQDIDNLGKAVLDGLNGVLYKDDRQVSRLTIQRRWSDVGCCILTICRNGLSRNELDNFNKYLSAHIARMDQNNDTG